MSTSETKEKMGKGMMTVVLSKSPQAWTEQVKSETNKWAEFIAENKIKFE
jgi:hypothetical protein